MRTPPPPLARIKPTPNDVLTTFFTHPLHENSTTNNCNQATPLITISDSTLSRIRAPWKLSLITKCYGKRLGFQYLSLKVKQLWPTKGTISIIDLGDDFFITRFSLEEDYLKALHGGPWFINGFFLATRLWEPNFNPHSTTTKSGAVWLRLPSLPVEYYDIEILKDVGSQVGTLLCIDTRTVNNERGRFARICVQIDLDKPIIPSIIIGNHSQNILYENVHLCFECGLLGHDSLNCPTKIPNIPSTVIANNVIKASPHIIDTQPEVNEEKNTPFGDRMVVKHKKRQTVKKPPAQLGNRGVNQTSFSSTSSKGILGGRVQKRSTLRPPRHSTLATKPLSWQEKRVESFPENAHKSNLNTKKSSNPSIPYDTTARPVNTLSPKQICVANCASTSDNHTPNHGKQSEGTKDLSSKISIPTGQASQTLSPPLNNTPTPPPTNSPLLAPTIPNTGP
ncbi:hypothetical protein LIER_05740 [Lithospermum erythrorhizon]|uniref:CCHC-type domain-containing protein n=1 Tax=Lithospermum erythrorhizon TaxID=34254 RepID=A0AAV3P3G0_LITER